MNGGSFTTAYQAGWGLTTKQSPMGAARYQLSSTGAQISGLGIPPAGTIAVTVDEMPTSALSVLHLVGAAPDRAATKQSPVELLPHAVGVPGGAQAVARVVSPHATILGGAGAAEEAYSYNLAGREIEQVDVLSQRDERVVLVELDAEATLADAGREALGAITGHWRWH